MFKTLHVVAGCMYSGKSERLKEIYEACKLGNKLYIKMTLQHQDHLLPTTVVTHGGNTTNGFMASSLRQVLDSINGECSHVVHLFIDEAQFIRDWNNWNKLIDNKNVYVACLDMDYKKEPFVETGRLMCQATIVEKKNATCECGRPAFYTARLSTEIETLVEDTGDNYRPTCGKCHVIPSQVIV